MANIIAGRSFVALRPARFPSLPNAIGSVRRLLPFKTRQEADAEAIVNRFSSDRWSDAIEREISNGLSMSKLL